MRVKLSTGGQDGGAEGSRAKPTIFRSARPAARRRGGQAAAEQHGKKRQKGEMTGVGGRAGLWSRGLPGEADHFPVGEAGGPKARGPNSG